MRTLAAVFQSHYRGHCAPPKTLEPILQQLVGEARSAWPELTLEPARFVEHIAARLPEGRPVEEALSRLRAPDLFLACSCLVGDRRAIELFEHRLLSQLPLHLAHLRLPPATVQEVHQQLSERLLLGGPERAPKIGDYSGQGALGAWVRVAAVRTALNLRRGLKREVQRDSDSSWKDHSPDPELRLIKARYQGDFQKAFQEVLQSLSQKERNLLRLHFLDGLNVDQLGTLLHVHRATAARWVQACRMKLIADIQALLRDRLRLTASEYGSLAGLVQSQLEVSIHRFLK